MGNAAIPASGAEIAAQALEHAGDAVIAIDTKGDIILWNEHCVKLFGFSKKQAIGQSVELMIPPKLRDAHWGGFDAAMESGQLASDGKARRTKALTADGGTVYVTMTFAIMKNDAGETTGSVAVAREWVREG